MAWHPVRGTEIVVRKATLDEEDDDVKENDSDVESCGTDATATVEAKVKQISHKWSQHV